jgi:cytidine deaminase
MANKLAESRHSHSARTETAHAIDLINLDERDEANDYGQRTAEAFAMSDIFLDCSTPVALSEQLRRNLRVVFSHPFETPHKDEVGMFHAAAASRRSASLDRQVGASLFRQDGTIIAVGCNEVPLAGGGQYWPSYMDQGHDNRQFQTGEDIGKAIQDILIGDIHRRLVSEKLIKDEYKNDRGVEKLRKALDLKKRGMERSRVLDLLEFKREVHAEMAAISDAARHGTLTRDAVLYTTVFPCHECTRHIVAAGIREVVYIEPYPKSMASKLHGDAVAVEELPCDGRVRFRPFVGISPQRYMDYFEAPERKAPKSRSCPAHGCTDLAFWSGNNQLLNIRPHEYGPCINAHLKVSCTKL